MSEINIFSASFPVFTLSLSKDKKKVVLEKLKLCGAICLISLTSFFIFCLQSLLFPAMESHFHLMNPVISGFLHAGISHWLSNVVMIFFLLLPSVNRNFSTRQLFIITTLLSLLYLPISVSGLTATAIGLSGLWFFLSGRYLFTWKRSAILGKTLAGILLLAELMAGSSPADGVAHWMHVIGLL